MKRIADDVLSALMGAETDGSELRITRDLGRKLYLETNKVLEALGGKWNRKAKAHIFDGSAAEAIEVAVHTGSYVSPKDFGFFPTPPELVETMLDRAEIGPHDWVLEPSAGTGAIARPIAELGHDLDCVELLPKHANVLRRELPDSVVVHERDFLDMGPVPEFDRAVMNPPFSQEADIRHVLHAMQFLRSGGRLVAVMSAGVTFRQTKLAARFRMIVDMQGTIEDLPAGSFKSGGTSVSTVLVTLEA